MKMKDLQTVTTSLFGFSWHEVYPLGQIRLSLSFGVEPTRKAILVTFTMVDTFSSCNAILGHPILSSL